MKFSSPVYSAVSGSIAGVTYSHNRSGMYTRARATPTNPNTIRQQMTRAAMGGGNLNWLEDLGPDDRITWENWASQVTFTNKLGLPFKLTGQQAYVRHYLAASAAGLMSTPNNIAATPPDNGNPIQNVGLTQMGPAGIILDNSGTAMQTDLWVSGGGASAAGAASIFIGPPVSAGVNYYKGPYQFVNNLPVTLNDTVINWTTSQTAFHNSNGPIVDGQRRPIKVRLVYDDGRLTSSFEAVLAVTTAAP